MNTLRLRKLLRERKKEKGKMSFNEFCKVIKETDPDYKIALENYRKARERQTQGKGGCANGETQKDDSNDEEA